MADASDVLCIGCGQPALERCTTEAARREVAISGLCEPCFFEWCGIDPDGSDDDQDEELSLLVEGACDGCPAYGMLSPMPDGSELCATCQEAAGKRIPPRIPERFTEAAR